MKFDATIRDGAQGMVHCTLTGDGLTQPLHANGETMFEALIAAFARCAELPASLALPSADAAMPLEREPRSGRPGVCDGVWRLDFKVAPEQDGRLGCLVGDQSGIWHIGGSGHTVFEALIAACSALRHPAFPLQEVMTGRRREPALDIFGG